MTPLKQALTLHLLTETPASFSFLLAPRAQLPGASPEATLILRNFGGLLMATNLACVVLLTRPADDEITALLCLSLGTYHVWPIARAWTRMKWGRQGARKEGQGEKKVLGGPVVHFVVHVACLVMMVGSAGAVLLRA
jgi:hypothetical protein